MKEYELMEEDYKKIDCPDRPCGSCPENIYGVNYCGYEVKVATAAQKKMLKYQVSEHMLDHFTDDFITGKHHPTCKACQLLKDFGIIGGNNANNK